MLSAPDTVKELVPLARVSTSAPEPRSKTPPVMVVDSVMLSAPEPPFRDSTFDRVTVFAPVPVASNTKVSVPEPKS